MSDLAEPQGVRPATQTRRFRRTADVVRLTPDQRRRQEVLVRATLDLLGSNEGIKAFLNDRCEALGGRPLNVAIASDDGLARTMAMLGDRVAAPSRD